MGFTLNIRHSNQHAIWQSYSLPNSWCTERKFRARAVSSGAACQGSPGACEADGVYFASEGSLWADADQALLTSIDCVAAGAGGLTGELGPCLDPGVLLALHVCCQHIFLHHICARYHPCIAMPVPVLSLMLTHDFMLACTLHVHPLKHVHGHEHSARTSSVHAVPAGCATLLLGTSEACLREGADNTPSTLIAFGTYLQVVSQSPAGAAQYFHENYCPVDEFLTDTAVGYA